MASLLRKDPKSPSGWVIIIVYIEMPYQFFCFSKLIPFFGIKVKRATYLMVSQRSMHTLGS